MGPNGYLATASHRIPMVETNACSTDIDRSLQHLQISMETYLWRSRAFQVAQPNLIQSSGLICQTQIEVVMSRAIETFEFVRPNEVNVRSQYKKRPGAEHPAHSSEEGDTHRIAIASRGGPATSDSFRWGAAMPPRLFQR